jgi:hypothetical protein
VALVVVLAALGTPPPAAPRPAGPPEGHALEPVSGADGAFEVVSEGGVRIHRARKDDKGAFALYLYFRAPGGLTGARGPWYVEVTYRDVGLGLLSLQYNAAKGDYQEVEAGYGRELTDRGGLRTAVFLLAEPSFRRAQNLQTDLRLVGPGPATPFQVVGARLFLEPTPLFTKLTARPWLEPYQGPTRNDVDARSLRHKVLCGYQGWFRCPGDGCEQGWVHWSRDRTRVAPDTLTVDLWPDMTEYSEEERFPVPGLTSPGGGPAHLFSSAHPRTVQRHFEWMQAYGLDGAFVQRFVPAEGQSAEAARVLGHARAAAHRTGRVFAVEYDMSQTPPGRVYDDLVRDWKWLVDEMRITRDPRYLHHDGRPVLAVYGFFTDRFGPDLAHRIIDFFKNDPKYRVCLVGGCQWTWRTEKNAEWARAFRRFDVIKPWNVGNAAPAGGKVYANVAPWPQDLAEARRAGMRFMPVVYPGFSWDNLQKSTPGKSLMPRLRGEFYWKQFVAAASLGVETVFVAMFDEVDEGTAVFKVTNAPPRPGHFVTLEGMPPDWYLRLTSEGTRLIRKERRPTPDIPIKP